MKTVKARSFDQVTYSIAEAAALLGVSPGLLYRQVHEGNINAIRIGRKMLLHQNTVKQLLGV